MKTTYVLDTSVLVHDPHVFKSFSNSEVVLPITALEELDKLKKSSGDAGRNARVAIRLLDEISEKGDISIGVLLDDEVLVKVDNGSYEKIGDPLYGDSRILGCALGLRKAEPSSEVTVVSNDINMRIRARALGLTAKSHDKDGSKTFDLYSGVREIVNEELGNELKSNNAMHPEGLGLLPNECVVFVDKNGNEMSKGRKVTDKKIRTIKKQYPWALSPRNREQEFAIDLIMDTKIPLVTLVGKAGTGKSLIALASALELVLEKHSYDKLVVYRPIQAVGADIGFLPGDINEKLFYWFSAIMDNLEVLFTSSSGDRWKTSFELAKKKDRIQFEAITYIRGRSIPRAIILVDECQNISRDEMKTILTRVGEDTKIILTGDLDQIDTRHLDPINNGLAYVIEKFKDSYLAGHITLMQGERSELATLASSVL